LNFSILKINWKGLLFWSNQFYGICAVLLAMESSWNLLHKFPSISLLVLIHCTTVLYYTHAYLLESKDGIYNERSTWYAKHKKYLWYRQAIYTIIVFLVALLQFDFISLIMNASPLYRLLLLVTVIVCILYYLPSFLTKNKSVIRQWGILKSISIAWAWTFTCCVLPIWVFDNIDKAMVSLAFWLHLIPLFLFLLILAILFDIKDIARDKMESIHTLAVKMGKERIVMSAIMPILFMYAVIVGYDYYIFQKSNMYLINNIILIGLIILVAKVILKKDAIYTNILLVDGLIIVKVILSFLEF
jgi:4-hydroxybenzoate polyprenyltransferase